MIAQSSRTFHRTRKQRRTRVEQNPQPVGPLSHHTARRWAQYEHPLPPAVLIEEAVLWSVPHPDTGTPLVELVLGTQGPSLRLYDHDGNMRVQLCACPRAGSAVEVCGETGEPLAALWDLGGDGGSVLAFSREGESKAALYAGAQAESGRVELKRVTRPGTEPGMLGDCAGAALRLSDDGLVQAVPLVNPRG